MKLISSFFRKTLDFKGEAKASELIILFGLIIVIDLIFRLLVLVNPLFWYGLILFSIIIVIPSFSLIIRYMNVVFREDSVEEKRTKEP